MTVAPVYVCTYHQVVVEHRVERCNIGENEATLSGKEPWCHIVRGTIEYNESPKLERTAGMVMGAIIGYVLVSLWFQDGGSVNAWSVSLEHLVAMLGLALFGALSASKRKVEHVDIRPDPPRLRESNEAATKDSPNE